MSTLNLSVLIRAIDRVSAPMRAINRSIGGITKPARIARMAVLSLGRDLRRLSMIGGAGVTVLGAGLFRLVRGTANAGDEAVKTSQKVGVGVEAWQRYAYAARLADVDSAQLADGLKYLNQSAAAAASGAGQDAKAFRALGISVLDQNGRLKSTGALFEELATTIAAMPDGAAKGSAAMTLMGRAGTDLIPLLNSGGEAIRRLGDEAESLGIIIPEEEARKMEEFNDSLTTMMESIRGLGIGISTGLIPQLTQLIKKTTAWIGANKTAVIEKVKGLLTQISDALPGILKSLGSFTTLLGDIARALAPVIRLMGGFGAVLDLMAALMIGRVAIAIWTATKAVLGLNAAMYANPIGLVIAGIAALVFAGWMLYRNWDKVVAGLKAIWGLYLKYCTSIWDSVKTAFKSATGAIWNLMPAWLRVLLRAGKWTIGVVGRGLDAASGGGAGGRPTPMPRPALPTGRSQLDAGGRMRIDLFDNRRPQLTARPNDPRMVYDWGAYRGGVAD